MGNNPYDTEELRQMKTGQAERLRELEAENTKLKAELAILTLDKLILTEAVEENDRGSAGNYPAGR
jgi:cell division protein FtsB